MTNHCMLSLNFALPSTHTDFNSCSLLFIDKQLAVFNCAGYNSLMSLFQCAILLCRLYLTARISLAPVRKFVSASPMARPRASNRVTAEGHSDTILLKGLSQTVEGIY
jgi:hypothetical protein